MLPDTVQSSGGLMLECSSQGRRLVGSLSLLGVHTASIMAPCKTNAECFFFFLPYFHKNENPLQISFG